MLWSQEREQAFPPLRGRHKADVCVVGGGLSGLTTALWLSRTGLKVAVLEAERMGSGLSSCCAGKVFLPMSVIASFEGEKAQTSIDIALSAIQTIREMNEKGNFDWHDAALQVYAHNDEQTASLEGMFESLRKHHLPAEWSNCPVPSPKSFRLSGMGMLNVGKYLSFLINECLSNHCTMYENTRVIAVETDRVLTETASLMAPYIVIATGYPIVNVPGWYFIRMEQREGRLQRWQGSAGNDLYMSVDEKTAIRPFQNGSLVQVCGNYIGNRRNEEELDNRIRELTRNMQMEKMDEPIRCIETCTADGMPYAGPYSVKTPNMFVASGYSGAGLVGSVIAAKAISAAVLGLPMEAYSAFSPQRKQSSAKMSLSIGARYVGGWFRRPRAPVCPHLGCKLRYNPHARIWECPCHGSRFDDIGHVLNTPAIRPAVLKDRR